MAESLLLQAAAQNNLVVPSPGARVALQAGGVSGFEVQIRGGVTVLLPAPA